MRFSSHARFISALLEVDDLDDLHPEPALGFDLVLEIAALLNEDSQDGAFLLAIYLSHAGSLITSNLPSLADHPDVLLRESFADFLKNHVGAD